MISQNLLNDLRGLFLSILKLLDVQFTILESQWSFEDLPYMIRKIHIVLEPQRRLNIPQNLPSDVHLHSSILGTGDKPKITGVAATDSMVVSIQNNLFNSVILRQGCAPLPRPEQQNSASIATQTSVAGN
jgi:hypothetical protein